MRGVGRITGGLISDRIPIGKHTGGVTPPNEAVSYYRQGGYVHVDLRLLLLEQIDIHHVPLLSVVLGWTGEQGANWAQANVRHFKTDLARGTHPLSVCAEEYRA